MKILAIDTSTLTGSVALLEVDQKVPVTFWSGVRVLGEITLSVSVQHSERLMPAIRMLLKDTLDPPRDIDLLAASHGPGSFTGLRIGLATVQGLSMATGKPAIGVSSLEALAMNGVFFDGLVIPILDARRGEVYAAGFQNGKKVMDEKAVAPEKLLEELDGGLFLGSGAETYGQLIRERLGDRARFVPPPLNLPRAAHVGLLAWRAWEKDPVAAHHQSLAPRYVRPVAVTFPRP